MNTRTIVHPIVILCICGSLYNSPVFRNSYEIFPVHYTTFPNFGSHMK